MWAVISTYDDFSSVGYMISKVYNTLPEAAEQLLNDGTEFEIIHKPDEIHSLRQGITAVVEFRPDTSDVTRTEQQVYDDLSLIHAEHIYKENVSSIGLYYDGIQRHYRLVNNDLRDYEIERWMNTLVGYKARWENLPDKLSDELLKQAIEANEGYYKHCKERLAASCACLGRDYKDVLERGPDAMGL